jgi:hypothetical protein
VCDHLIPYPTIDWKFHKPSRGGRYITACHNAVTAQASGLLGSVLTAITPALKDIWAEEMGKLGITDHVFPVALSSECVGRAINVWQKQTPTEERPGAALETIDFEAFYPSVPHDDLKRTIMELVAESLERMKCTGAYGDGVGECVLRVDTTRQERSRNAGGAEPPQQAGGQDRSRAGANGRWRAILQQTAVQGGAAA